MGSSKLQTDFDAPGDKYDRESIKKQHQKEVYKRHQERKLIQIPESLYSVKKQGAKKTLWCFLARSQTDASLMFSEYLMKTRKTDQSEVNELYRIGTFDPNTNLFTSEIKPSLVKSS